MSDARELEKRGLWLSIVGALFMAALGIGFAVVTSSDAVLLDGLFSLVGCVVGLVALRVAALIARPDDDVFHFGYAAYEPMLNLTKGLLMAFIALFALVSAIADAFHGGREVDASWASVYAVIAATGCFAIAASQRRLSKKIHSPMLDVDSKNWFVDGLFSIAVAVAFSLAYVLSNSRFAHLLPYVDPAVVIVLVFLSLPIPIRIIRGNWNQLIGKAPDASLQQIAMEAVDSVQGLRDAGDSRLRMQQIGRYTYVQLYVVCGDSFEGGVRDQDRYRDALEKSLAAKFENLAMDVLFTGDERWVAVSVGNHGATEHQGEQQDATETQDVTGTQDATERQKVVETQDVVEDSPEEMDAGGE